MTKMIFQIGGLKMQFLINGIGTTREPIAKR